MLHYFNTLNKDKPMKNFVAVLKSILIIFSFVSCAQAPKGEPTYDQSLFSGTFECPEYKGSDNKWNSSVQKKIQLNFEGIPIIIEKTNASNPHKHGPYTTRVTIADGLWRYTPLYRSGKLYPVKVKVEIKDKIMYWEAKYPEIKKDSGKIRKPSQGTGRVWLDKKGNLLAEGSHYTGTQVCKRLK